MIYLWLLLWYRTKHWVCLWMLELWREENLCTKYRVTHIKETHTCISTIPYSERKRLYDKVPDFFQNSINMKHTQNQNHSYSYELNPWKFSNTFNIKLKYVILKVVSQNLIFHTVIKWTMNFHLKCNKLGKIDISEL